MEYLRSRWVRTLEEAGCSDSDHVIDQVLEAYSEAQRKYHTTQHLEQCFQVLDEVFPDHIPCRAAIELALWFHDYVYTPTSQRNEDLTAFVSRNLIITKLNGSSDLAGQVQELILLTKHNAPTNSIPEKILVDVDLSILGVSPGKFDIYEAQVREEYSMYPDELFRPGRAGILQQFLARDRIYQTDPMHFRFEQQARRNLERSLKALV